MKEPEVSKADVSTELELPMYESIAAGFPITSDYVAERLDFNRDFIKHPESTFYVRVKGDSMKDAGIFDGDLCVVDKAEELSHGNIVAAYYNNGFTVKYLDTSTKDQGFIRLVPANKDFKPFIVDASDEFSSRLLWMPPMSLPSGAKSFSPLETGGTAIVCHSRL